MSAITGREHLSRLRAPLEALDADVAHIDAWGRHLAEVLVGGGRLLVAGNGGSAAQAQHLTAELVGRYQTERRPLSAIALHAETSSVTAIGNDYGQPEVYARQVRAHGRPGDVLLALSTSGRSPNVCRAAEAAREIGCTVWALTGPGPTPLGALCDDAVTVSAPLTATVQEVHQVVVHLLCAAVDAAISAMGGAGDVTPATATPVAAATQITAPAAKALTGDTTATRDRSVGGCRPVVVVGDALLDVDLEGPATRLAPDAPVPVLDGPVERLRPGGAALAAVLAAGDGHPVTLVTALGTDEAGRHVHRLLAAAGVEVADLGLAGPTPRKVRVRAAGQALARLDYGGTASPCGPLTAAARTAIESAAAVLVSDYGRGITAEPSVRDALHTAASHRPLVWDPHPRGSAPVPGARLVTPNAAEAQRLSGDEAAAAGEEPGLADITRQARTLLVAWGAAGVAVTRGSRGALFVAGDGSPLAVPAPPIGAGDPCGAGDRFAARAATALAAGALPLEAVPLAVACASAFVAAGGAAAWPHPGAHDGARAGASAAEVVAATRARGGTVVATGGCFDLLHAGHVRMLVAARALGDCLVVCLNSDASVRRLKGPDRPLVPAADRAAVLTGLDAVDAVEVFDEDTPEQVLASLRPDVWVKGGDYALGDLPEARVLAGWGGQAVLLPYLSGRSTTDLLTRATARLSERAPRG